MNWNKLRKQLEGFLNEGLVGRVEYIPSGYRYSNAKKNQAYLTVDKKEIFRIKEGFLKWYDSEQDIKNDPDLYIPLTQKDLDAARKLSGDRVPEERLKIIAAKNTKNQYAKDIMKAQNDLLKADFHKTVNVFLSASIDDNFNSDDILLNVLSILDRRVGKNRLRKMDIRKKHPIVRYFYDLRLNS